MILLDDIPDIRKVIDRTETDDGKLVIIMKHLGVMDLGQYVKDVELGGK